MQLKPISSPEVRLPSTEPTKAAPAPSSAAVEIMFQAASQLSDALKATPDVRSEKIARAAGLVASVKYPPTELIAGISHLLAHNWPPSSNQD
jgi:hypothetical protein